MLDHRGMTAKERHKQQLRMNILEAASGIILCDGVERLTIRKIAAAIDYSVPMVYEHFLNKQALLQELQKEWLKQILELIQRIHAQEENPKVALEKIAVTYLEFAKENGVFYRVAMDLKSGPMDGRSDFPEIHSLRTILKDLIRQVHAEELLTERALENQVDLLRSMLHGVVSLMLANKLKGGHARALNLIKNWLIDFMTCNSSL